MVMGGEWGEYGKKNEQNILKYYSDI